MAYKKYAYYNKGNKVAIVELESASEDSPTEFTRYISPKTDVTDGLEIEYAYAPSYNIDDESESSNITAYTEDGTGFLTIVISGAQTLTKDSWILVEGSNQISGLHQIQATVTGTSIVTNTRYSGALVTEASTMYRDVSFLQDESFNVDLSDYQAQAVVYYVKAKMAEEMRDMEGREYFLRLFKKQMEKSSRAKKRGLYKMQGFWGMRK
tara:strand:+ start:293 stop:919 length:627 start_codon:yes stop_codon:yes gene_type:complete